MTARERVGFGVLGALTLGVVTLVVGVIGFVVVGGASALSWEFLTAAPREGMTEGGIWPAIFGTLVLTMLTAVASAPLGLACAIWLVEYARDNAFTRAVRLSIRNLSGVPSVVYGLFGVALFVHGLGLGLSLLASGLTLGLLTLPWVITASQEALRTVPQSWREGAFALGASQWDTIRTIVVPAAAPGILTGVILGLARAAGETAPILFTGVTFSRPDLPDGVGDTYMALPYHLYILATQHSDPARVRPIAFATATVLIALVVLLNAVAGVARSRMRTRAASR